MKKTLAIALVLVMVVSCISVLFVSAAEVESLTVLFTQLEGSSTQDCSLTLHPGTDEEMELKSGDANIRWAYAMAMDAKGNIVRLGKNLLSEAQDTNNAFDNHGIKIPAGGYAVVFHCGDGENSSGNEDLRDYFNDLIAAAGVSDVDNTVAEVASAGWQAAGLTTEGGEHEFGSVTFYKGAAPAGSDPKPEPEPEVVEEVITVDGDLSDTGYDKAEWLTHNLWQNPKAAQPDDRSMKMAVRTDADNIYVAIEVVGTIAPNVLPEYAEKLTGDLEANGAQTTTYTQTGATSFRIWLRANKEERYLIDVQYLGEELGWVATRTIYPTGSTLTWDDLAGLLDIAVVYNEGVITAEFAVDKAAYGIESEFGIFTTFWDNYPDLVDDTYEEAYQTLHVCTEDTLTSETGVIQYYSGPENQEPYFWYNVKDIELGTYVVGGDEPEDTYEQDIAALVGDLLENPDFAINLESEIETVDGKNIMTVTLTVKDIKEGVHMQALLANLYYDTERLTLLTAISEKDNSVQCVSKLPYGDDSDWENMTKLSKDVEGLIEINFIVADTPDQYLDADHPIELVFTFELKEGFTKAGVYVTTEGTESTYAPADPTASDFATYYGNGAYTVASVKAVEEPSNSESTGSDPKPGNGDNGILVFAILGVLAVAGAATVIKVRH